MSRHMEELFRLLKCQLCLMLPLESVGYGPFLEVELVAAVLDVVAVSVDGWDAPDDVVEIGSLAEVADSDETEPFAEHVDE